MEWALKTVASIMMLMWYRVYYNISWVITDTNGFHQNFLFQSNIGNSLLLNDYLMMSWLDDVSVCMINSAGSDLGWTAAIAIASILIIICLQCYM